MAELRGEPIRAERDPEISADVPAFLPDDYLPDTGQRLDFYRRLAQASDDDAIRALCAELEDRYGPLPDEATLLAEVMGQKILVRQIGALAYELGPARLVLSLGPDSPLDASRVMRLVQAKQSRWKLSPDMRLSYAFDDGEKRQRLPAARARLMEVRACRTANPAASSRPTTPGPRPRPPDVARVKHSSPSVPAASSSPLPEGEAGAKRRVRVRGRATHLRPLRRRQSTPALAPD